MYRLGRTKAVNSIVYGEVATARDAWVVIIGGTKSHKSKARVSPSSNDKGSSVNSDNSGTAGSESTSALVPKYTNGAVLESKKVGCKPSHGAVKAQTRETLLRPRWRRRCHILQRTDYCLPTEDHQKTRGKVANTAAPLHGHHRIRRDPLQLPILHPDVRVGRRYLVHVFLVKVLAHLTENQSESEASGDVQSGYWSAYPGESGDRLKGVIIESDYGGRGGHDKNDRRERWGRGRALMGHSSTGRLPRVSSGERSTDESRYNNYATRSLEIDVPSHNLNLNLNTAKPHVETRHKRSARQHRRARSHRFPASINSSRAQSARQHPPL
jgi:hypothetical protein